MNLAKLFWQACKKAPGDSIAIATANTSETYQQLHNRVAALTQILHAQGVVVGDRIGICARNCPEYIETFWACVSIGAVVIPLNFRLSQREFAHLCAFADLKAYFCSADMLEKVCLSPETLKRTTLIVWGGAINNVQGALQYEALVGGEGSREPVVVEVGGDDLCAIIFTGGTSGTPKGVGRSHRNSLAQIMLSTGNDWAGQQRIVMACTPFFHIAGQLALLVLASGGTVTMISGSFSGLQFLQLVERFQVAAAFVVPAMISEIAGVDESVSCDTASLRELRSGGAPLPVEVAQRLVRRFPTLRFSNGAGSTEVGTMGAGWWDELSKREFGCVGRPPTGQEVRIINEHGYECPSDAMGEIIVRGAQVSQGYWGDISKTADVFLDGWQHTGDLGRVDSDGYLYLLDRKSDIIISGGENIYAREIEEVLYKIPRVREAAVIGIPDERWGETPLAILVTTDGEVATDDIQAALSDCLASYKQPRRYVVIQELPRTSIGKVDKKALRLMVKT